MFYDDYTHHHGNKKLANQYGGHGLFEYAFRLGVALMVEVLAGREELIRPKDYLMIG
jgi:hypothetical protein